MSQLYIFFHGKTYFLELLVLRKHKYSMRSSFTGGYVFRRICFMGGHVLWDDMSYRMKCPTGGHITQ